MTQTTTLANARLVLPGEVVTGSIRIRGGLIEAVDQGAGVPRGAVDCDGDFVAPGLIELHTDNLERHLSPRPQVKWPHRAAILAHDAELAGCGITTVFDALRVGSIPTGARASYGKYARGLASEILQMRDRGALRISHFLHLRAEICSATLIEELAEFGPADRVGIVSLMDHMPGQRQFRDISKYSDFVCGKYGLSEAEIAEHVANLTQLHDRLGARHEAAAVAEGKRLGAVLASHDDTTVDHVTTSAAHGVRLAEFPTTREAARACANAGIGVMMGAPNLMRGGSHSGNVAADDLAADGTLDILSSDYIPAALLAASVRLGALWGDMALGIGSVTSAPADAVGLDDRGRLDAGLRADVVRFRDLGDGLTRIVAVWSQGNRVS